MTAACGFAQRTRFASTIQETFASRCRTIRCPGSTTNWPRWSEQHLRRRLLTRDGPQSARLSIDGRELVNFGSNDYLALAADPRLARAVAEAVAARRLGQRGQPAGDRTRRTCIGNWKSGWPSSRGPRPRCCFRPASPPTSGAIAALVGPGDVVYCDRKNHASLLDGCRLSRADVRVYPHGDCGRLAALLARSQNISPAADRHRRPVQHGRRPGAAGGIGRSGRAVRRHALGRRGPRHGRFRPRTAGAWPSTWASKTASMSASAR